MTIMTSMSKKKGKVIIDGRAEQVLLRPWWPAAEKRITASMHEGVFIQPRSQLLFILALAQNLHATQPAAAELDASPRCKQN